MTGLLTLSNQILCKKEVLGRSFECEIAGVSTYMCFPIYPAVDDANPIIGICNPLRPPEIGATWKRDGEPISWGYPMNHPSGDSCVELVALSIDCGKEQIGDYAQTLYESIQKWEYAFLDYLKLETKQSTERDKNATRNTCHLELYEDEYIPAVRTGTIFLTIPKSNSFASEENIMNAIKYANSGKDFFLEYQMLLSAYEARNNNQNRLAIVNASSAIEICLVGYLRKRCSELNYDTDWLLEHKFRSLGDRIRLAKNLDPLFPSDGFSESVVKPRNDIAHNRDISPADITTDALITSAEITLEYFLGGRFY